MSGVYRLYVMRKNSIEVRTSFSTVMLILRGTKIYIYLFIQWLLYKTKMTVYHSHITELYIVKKNEW